MPNPENFTPIQRFRLDADTWHEFGELVGDRYRSSELKAYVEWRLGKPGARLPVTRTNQQRHGFLVWIDVEGEDRTAEVYDLPGTTGDETLRAAIEDAVRRHLAP
jgi:hypothetical protein